MAYLGFVACGFEFMVLACGLACFAARLVEYPANGSGAGLVP